MNIFGWLKEEVPVGKAKKEDIDEILSRGVVEAIQEDSLRKRLESGKKLRIKLGIDPTGADVHIGHAVLLLKLRDFQKLGHKIVLIIGDATGVIGDTSDKESERQMLKREEVSENKKTYLKQIGKVLDMDGVEVRHNSEWLDSLKYSEIGEQADLFSVAEFTARDNIKRRLDAGKRVSVREMLYPLMQGYDSVVVKADVELGGTDQRFNLLAGRTLQSHYGQKPQDVLMTELLEGTDGQKMSKSAGNTINIEDSPEEMYGKVMRVRDDLIVKYFALATRVSMGELEKIKSEIGNGNPVDIKRRLAFEVTKIYHGESEAQSAQNNFKETFGKGGIPENPDEIDVEEGESLMDAVVGANIVSSKTEFRRLVKEGAVRNLSKDEEISDPDHKPKETSVFRIGKKRFVKVVVSLG